MNTERQKQLRTLAVEHYFKPGCYPLKYTDWIDGLLDHCDRCLVEANIDKDVIELHELLAKVTEPDHTIAEATRAYVTTLDSPYLLDNAIARPVLLDALVAAVKGAR